MQPSLAQVLQFGHIFSVAAERVHLLWALLSSRDFIRILDAHFPWLCEMDVAIICFSAQTIGSFDQSRCGSSSGETT